MLGSCATSKLLSTMFNGLVVNAQNKGYPYSLDWQVTERIGCRSPRSYCRYVEYLYWRILL